MKINRTPRELRVATALDVAGAPVAHTESAPKTAGTFEHASPNHGERGDLEPHTQKGTPTGTNAAALLSSTKAMSSSKRWDPVSKLPPYLQARLSEGDRRAIKEAVTQLQIQVRVAKLDHVPVFGYLSLRTHNFAELGKRAQSDVVPGRDVVEAKLPGFDVDVLVSTMFRGTPEHPGAVAGLSSKPGATTPGTVLKLPIDRAEELLAVVLAREMFAEGDLVDRHDAHGPVSNALYAPKVQKVILDDGKEIPALVFATNEKGDKAIATRADPFAEGAERGLTVERMAYLFAAQGGFVDAKGAAHGGTAVDYWEQCYVTARKAAGEPVNPKIAAAVELSKLLPQMSVVDRLAARTDRDARLMTEAIRMLFTGMATPLHTKLHQKEDLGGLVRTPQGDRGDVVTRLLEKARELERDGKISI